MLSKTIGSLAMNLVTNALEHPDDIDNLVAGFEQEVSELVAKNKRQVFVELFVHLYGGDYERLQLDVLKQIVLDAPIVVTGTDRARLLRVALTSYGRWFPEDDYTILLNECYEKIKAYGVMEEAGCQLPFV